MREPPTIAQAKAALERFFTYRTRQLKRTHWGTRPDMNKHYVAREYWLEQREHYLKEVLRQAERARYEESLLP